MLMWELVQGCWSELEDFAYDGEWLLAAVQVIALPLAFALSLATTILLGPFVVLAWIVTRGVR